METQDEYMKHDGETKSEEVRRRVYDTEVSGEGSFRIIGEVARAQIRDTEASSRVDDIADGTVALVTFSDSPEATAYTRLGPEEAKQLGESLIAASEYAAEQQECERNE